MMLDASKRRVTLMFCYLYFLLFSSSASFFYCRRDQSYQKLIRTWSYLIFIYFECCTDPGLLKIRQLSTSCRCGLTSFKALPEMTILGDPGADSRARESQNGRIIVLFSSANFVKQLFSS